MARDLVRTPTSMTGIIRFYDEHTGGPSLDPRLVIVVSVLVLVAIKVLSFVIRSG